MQRCVVIVAVWLACTQVLAIGKELPRRLPPIPAASTTTGVTTVEAGSASEPSRAGDEIVLASFAPSRTSRHGLCDLPFETGIKFNKGLFLRSTDLDLCPYSMYVGARLQLRYLNFIRNEEEWTDNTGTTFPIRNRNNFDTERARINISGNAISPNLTYLFIIDGDSDDGANADFLIYQFEYKFCDALRIRCGRNKVSYGREWLMSSRYLTLSDRSMANDFFRSSFSDGIWLIGQPTEEINYELSITNGLATSRRRAINLDDKLAFAGSATWEPWGDYGFGTTDFQSHETPAMRWGISLATDKSGTREDVGIPLGDDDFLRLSDGTRLGALGSLAPGVQILGDTVYLAAIDAGMKYRGWNLWFEYFMRWIQDFRADGPISVSKLYTYGFNAEAGYFVVPKRLDVNLRMSQVSGVFGDGFEYSMGGNWYWGGQDDPLNKVTFDLSRVISSPVNSTLSDYRAGDDGVLIRTQIQFGF